MILLSLSTNADKIIRIAIPQTPVVNYLLIDPTGHPLKGNA